MEKRHHHSIMVTAVNINKYSIVGTFVLLAFCVFPSMFLFFFFAIAIYLVGVAIVNIAFFLALVIVVIRNERDRIDALKAMGSMIAYSLIGLSILFVASNIYRIF